MTLVLQLGLAFVVLVAPGLLTVSLAREVAPSEEGTPSAESTLLTALAIAIAVVATEFVVLSVASAIYAGLPAWGGLTLSEVVSDDPWSVVQENPGPVAVIASLEYLAHLALLAGLGWLNPFSWLLSHQLARHNLREAYPYAAALMQQQEAGERTVVYASAMLRDGRAYSGTLQSASFRPLSDGSRELFLQSVERIVGDERQSVGSDDVTSGLLLNTRDVVALELAYAPARPENERAA